MYLKIIGVSLLVLLLQHLWKILHACGYFVPIINQRPGQCYAVPGIDTGSEDMQTLSNGITLITSGLTCEPFPGAQTDKERPGRIFMFDYNHPEKNVQQLKFSDGFNEAGFMPHGIGLFENQSTGKVTVFVVNHHPTGDRIEKFEYIHANLLLKHIDTIQDDIMVNLNDVTPFSENGFYFTNLFSSSKKAIALLEVYLMLPWGSVGVCEGHNCQFAITNMDTPNGLIMSRDNKQLYLISGNLGMQVYSRADNNTLHYQQDFAVGGRPDNPSVDNDGNIWVAGHPRPIMLHDHFEDPSVLAPSQVLFLAVAKGNITSMQSMFFDDGDLISGSSVATFYNNKMLIGSVLDTLVLCDVCTLDR